MSQKETRPVGRPRGKTKPESETRGLVVAAAGRLLSERGYEGMSLGDVAAAAGVTKAALYHYFPQGKNQLIRAVADEMITRDSAEVTGVLATAEGVRGRLEAVAGWALSQDHHPARMLRDARRFLAPEESGEVFARFLQLFHAPIEAVFQEGIQAGKLRWHDTAFATGAFLSLLAEFGAGAADFPFPDLARQIVDLLLMGLLPPDAAKQE